MIDLHTGVTQSGQLNNDTVSNEQAGASGQAEQIDAPGIDILTQFSSLHGKAFFQ